MRKKTKPRIKNKHGEHKRRALEKERRSMIAVRSMAQTTQCKMQDDGRRAWKMCIERRLEERTGKARAWECGNLGDQG